MIFGRYFGLLLPPHNSSCTKTVRGRLHLVYRQIAIGDPTCAMTLKRCEPINLKVRPLYWFVSSWKPGFIVLFIFVAIFWSLNFVATTWPFALAPTPTFIATYRFRIIAYTSQ